MKRAIHRRIRRTAITIPLVAAIVFVTMPLSGCGLRSLTEPSAAATAQAPKPRTPSGAEKFAAASDSLTGALDEAQKAFAKGSTSATALADIADFAKALPKLDKGVKSDFAKTRKVLKRIDSPEKDAIQRKVEAQYAARVKTLESHLAAISSAQGGKAAAEAIEETSEWLASITPEEPYQLLGTELPHRIVDRKAGPPVLGTSIAPAYAPDTPGAEPSTLPVTPTAADTSETIEIQFTPEITSLVASLGADPVRMYEYVRNTIDFEPYYGSRKGATETYLEGSGNDIDTASLLIALYRKAGIPARYVSGVVDIPIDKAMNWVGVQTPEAAARMFASGGTPTTTLISGGKPKALRIEHTWAEVYVDYEDYRGVGAGDGERVWVPLDASFKEYEETPQIDVGEYLTEAQKDAYASVLASATSVDETGFVTVDYAAVSAATAMLTAEATAVLAAAPEAQEIKALAGYRGPRPSHVGILPSMLGFTVRQIDSEWAAVPDSAITKLHLSVETDSGKTVLAYDAPLPQIGEGKIVLGFVPAGPDDQSIRAAHTSIEDVAAYLMSTKPELLVGSSARTGTGEMQLGEGATFYVASSLGGVTNRLCSTPVTAGGMYAVGLDLGRVARAHVASSSAEFTSPFRQAASGGLATQLVANGFVGGMLHAGALLYFRHVDDAQGGIAGSLGIRRFRELSALVTGTGMEAVSTLGMPVSVRCPGMLFDVGTDASLRVSMSAETTRSLVACNMASGAVSSSVEGWLWHALFGVQSPGISTVTALEQCMSSGSPIAAIDSTNVEVMLSTVNVPSGVAADIRDQVAQGRVVSLPTTRIDEAGWSGVAYTVVDPETGDGGYMLSGGLAGGVDPWEGVEQALWTMMATLLVAGPISPGLTVTAWLVSEASLAISYGTTMRVLQDSKGQDAALLQAFLSTLFVASFGALQGLLVAGLGSTAAAAAATGGGATYIMPCVAQALGVLSLAVAMHFWVWTVVLRQMAE